MVLISAKKKGYLGNALETAFIAHKMEAILNYNDIYSLHRIKGIECIVVLSDDEYVSDLALITKIKDVAIDNNTHLFIMGEASSNAKMKELFPTYLIEGIYDRPFNVMDAVLGIKNFIAEKDVVRDNVLLVDDDTIIAMATRQNLEQTRKYNVQYVTNAVDALKECFTNPPDIILLDYRMPICNGEILLGMIKQSKDLQHIPVVMCSCDSSPEVVKNLMKYKPDGYVVKPATSEVLMETLDKALKEAKIKEAKTKEASKLSETSGQGSLKELLSNINYGKTQ